MNSKVRLWLEFEECFNFIWNPIEARFESLWGRPRFKLNSPHLISFKQQVETFHYFGNLLALPSQRCVLHAINHHLWFIMLSSRKKRTFTRKPFGAAFDSLAPAVEKNDFFLQISFLCLSCASKTQKSTECLALAYIFAIAIKVFVLKKLIYWRFRNRWRTKR